MKNRIPTWADLQSRLSTLAKGVRCDEPSGDFVIVYQSMSAGEWYWHGIISGRTVNDGGEGYVRRGQASQQAIVHGSPWLPVYRKELNGTWSFLRAPLLTGFGAKQV